MGESSLTIERTAAAWLARRDSGDWPPTAQIELERWLDQATAHRVAFLRLHTAWEEAGRLRALGAGVAEARPTRSTWLHHAGSGNDPTLQRRASTRRLSGRHASRRRAWVAVAVISVLVASIALGGRFWRPLPTSVAVTRYSTGVGQVRTVALADGSRAVLNSDSRIEVRLAPATRDIALTRGEAIFEVAKDHRRPFIVATGGFRAVAVGTRYSVRASDAGLRVVVTEGTVRLESPARGSTAEPSVMLPAGSVALVRGNDVLVRSLTVADAQQMLDWRNGFLTFHDTSLADAANEFNRYTSCKLVIADPEAGALRIGGSFRWDNEAAFVRLLQAGLPVRADVQACRTILHSR